MSYWNKKSYSGELLDYEVYPPTSALPIQQPSETAMVSAEWQAEMDRILETMKDESASSSPVPPVSHVRQCAPEEDTNGERGSHLPETATEKSVIKAG